jgi:hypothetical protein
MKVIFITGYWKSGTTLLQFLLAKDKQVQNVFPRANINYDGTEFWKCYLPQHTTINGHYIPNRIADKVDTDTIRGWFNKFYDGSECILLKRPQFVMNDYLIKKIWPHAHIIATRRDLLPNIYSMMRMRKLNNYLDEVVVGQYVPGWKEMKHKEPMERLVHQYCYVNNYLDKRNIFTIDYDDLCDNPEETLYAIGKEINHNFDIDIPTITNCDIDYIEGTTLRSRNDDTAKGIIPIDKKGNDFPPFTSAEINKIHEYYDKYKDIDVI